MAIKRSTYQPDDKYGLVDVTGVARLLGLSKSSVYKMTMRMELPYYKVGGKIVFKVEQIMAWLEEKKAKN